MYSLRHAASRERHDKVALALDLVGLADRHDHYPRQLSGGQEQRVAIARAIVADPKILVADEPTGDLDAQAAASVMQLLKRLNAEMGKTLVMVTHDPKVAAQAGLTLHLEKGQLAERSEETRGQGDTETSGRAATGVETVTAG
jgi:putative ABC transport system ATP-binding protein